MGWLAVSRLASQACDAKAAVVQLQPIIGHDFYLEHAPLGVAVPTIVDVCAARVVQID